jgi:poly-gamma-glutamate capsule biosynthesis protein CapA/YwtB (metallophosphatase superfamily)
MLAFGAFATGCLAVVGWQVAVAGAPSATAYTEISVVPQQPGSVSVTIAGDTMFGDGAAELIDTQGIEATLVGVTEMFRDADVGVVNLESPITARNEPLNPGAQYSYGSAPETAAALAAIGVDVVQLGNNHTFDQSAGGLADSIELTGRAGIAMVGAGADLAEASRPLLVRAGETTVALVSLGEDYGSSKRAGEGVPGMVPFSAESVLRGERVARQAGADYVIALVHWGDNYADIDASQRYWASQLVAAGYDAVIGTGPHVLQPVEVIDGVPVAYSIGNFVFGSPGRYASFGRSGLGAVVTVSFSADGGTLAFRCLRTDNAVVNYVPRECDASESAVAASELKGGLAWQGPTGTLRF